MDCYFGNPAIGNAEAVYPYFDEYMRSPRLFQNTGTNVRFNIITSFTIMEQ
jgi:hypothetical protein